MDSTVKIKRRRKVSLEKKKARAGYIFVAPFLLGILLIYKKSSLTLLAALLIILISSKLLFFSV